jgi:site-specific recombinase XerD
VWVVILHNATLHDNGPPYLIFGEGIDKGEPISERGVRKLVVKYRKNAGITKRASCHTLRHTFATYKAEKGVSPFQLQQWLGHANLNTTQIYVHLGKQNAKKIMEQTSLA